MDTSERAPSFETWKALPREDLARPVRARHLSIKVALDGTRRHFLLKHPNETGKCRISDNTRLSRWPRL